MDKFKKEVRATLKNLKGANASQLYFEASQQLPGAKLYDLEVHTRDLQRKGHIIKAFFIVEEKDWRGGATFYYKVRLTEVIYQNHSVAKVTRVTLVDGIY